MWTWSLNWNEITERLVVGSCPMHPADLERIRKGAGATAMLSLQHDDCLDYWRIHYTDMRAAGEQLGMRMARVPIRDFDVEDSRRQLPAAVTALSALIRDGRRVYVHCTAGLGRAPVTVIAYLVLVEGLDADQAFRFVKERRAGSVPAWEAFDGCRRDLADRWNSAILRRARDLAARDPAAPAEANWFQAQAEILREVLTGRPPPPTDLNRGST